MLSSHDVPRHASRYALPTGLDPDDWLIGNGGPAPSTHTVGQRRARAATLMMLALPGSAYLYQGEELGLLEVADLRPEDLRDPVWERTGHLLKGRDGCRVPLPWRRTGPSFGFGERGAWLPQPDWFAEYSVESEEGDDESSLALYRRALALRRKLADDDLSLTWLNTEDHDVLHFARANGWECLVNFGTEPKPVPEGHVIVSSVPMPDRLVPPESTVWVLPHDASPQLGS